MNNVKILLDEELEKRLKEISDMSVDDENYSKAVDNLVKFQKMRSDEMRAENEIESTNFGQSNDLIQRYDKKKESYLHLALEAAGIVLPLAFYAKWMKTGFIFEEKGTFTSTTFRELFRRFKPGKV